MKILAVAQVTDQESVLRQIDKQTVKPDHHYFLVDDMPAQGINARRVRIASNQIQLQDIVALLAREGGYDFVWQIEGDSECEADCLERLIIDYEKLKSRSFGYISGIQVGRHGLYHLGAWNIGKDEFTSIDYKKKGINRVDATGLYCLFAPIKVWLRGKPTWDNEPWGPDVNWGLSLKDQGFKTYVDMDIKVGHRIKRGIIYPEHISTCNVKFTKQEDGKWKFKTSE